MVRLLGRCLPISCIPRRKRQSFPIGEQQTNGTKHQEKINKLFVRRVESIRVTHQAAVVKRLPLHTINERQQLEQKKPKTKSPRHQHHKEKLIKPDDTEFDCETHISDPGTKRKTRKKSKKKSSSIKQKKTPSPSRTPLQKLFNKTKKISTPSPKPPKTIDEPNKDQEDDDDDDDDTTSTISSSTASSSSIPSDWSTTTYPDSESSDKSNIPIQRRQSMPVTNLTNENPKLKHRSCLEGFYLGKEQTQSSLPPSHTKKTLPKIKDLQQEQNKRNDMKPSAKSKQVLQNVRKMIKDQNVQEQHFNDKQRRESVRL